MAPFKEQIDRGAVTRLAGALGGAWAGFARDRFVHAATEGLAPLELKARVAHVARALAAHLPQDFAAAARVVEAAVTAGAPWRGFDLWPVQHWVMVQGIDHSDTALPLVARVTPHFSGEFALRPFIDRDPPATLDTLRAWALHPDAHVRRLASEGSRPRLPWGARVRVPYDWALEVLEALYADPSEYVRRSVANHLNDVSHLDPDCALRLAARWMAAPAPHGAATARHGLRTLIKRGHPAALALVGADHGAAVGVQSLTVSPDTVAIGGTVTLTLCLVAEGDAPTPVVVDYRVDYVGARGTNARTFKWCTRTLRPGVAETLVKRQHFRDVSIRKHRPGVHTVTALVNGRAAATATVTLVAAGEEDGQAG